MMSNGGRSAVGAIPIGIRHTGSSGDVLKEREQGDRCSLHARNVVENVVCYCNRPSARHRNVIHDGPLTKYNGEEERLTKFCCLQAGEHHTRKNIYRNI